jgi:hypothetical protein
VALPPESALATARALANLALGERRGDVAFSALRALEIVDGAALLTLDLDDAARRSVMDAVRDAVAADLPRPEAINRIHDAILSAVDAGVIPWPSDMAPFLRFALSQALAGDPATPLPERYAAAAFALAKACSPSGYGRLLAPMVGDATGTPPERRGKCSAATLAGRKDSREHFVISAALRAASNRGVSVRIGEYKELDDSLPGGSGFDFSDIAANRAGVRLSDRMMAAAPEEWPALIARIDGESAFAPPLSALPQRLSDAEFARLYGDVESTEYRELIALIDARIDRLALYR